MVYNKNFDKYRRNHNQNRYNIDKYKKHKSYKKISINELKQQTIRHIIAIKKLLKIQNKLFVSTKEERRKENIRKAFHFCGMIIPCLMLLLTQKMCIIILLCILTPLLIADYNNLALICKRFTRLNIVLQLFREHELIHGKLSGLSWLLIGLLLSVTVFDKTLASMSIAVLIVGDASAALIGKNFGKIKICGSKTLEGTIAFIAFGITTAYLAIHALNIPNLSNFFGLNTNIFIFNPIYTIISVVIASLVELTSKNIDIDDNFSVPISFCLTYKILMILL